MKLPAWLQKKKKEAPPETDHRVVYPLGPIDRQAERNNRVMRAGWIFLGVVVAAVLVAVLLLLPKRERGAREESKKPSAETSAAAAEPQSGEKAPATVKKDGPGGQNVRIRAIECEYAPPAELTLGVVRSVDLSALASEAEKNVAEHGWGKVEHTLSADGSLLLYSAERSPLNAADYDKQDAFLASDQPENMARTFLQDSGIIDLLRSYGISVSAEAENNRGEIVFRGSGEGDGAECSIRFSFLFTGAFNQAKLHAVYMEDALTTAEVVPVKKAASTAISWSSSGEEETVVTAVELRSIRGLPFYVFLCEDGTAAYALAVKENVLDTIPELRGVYEEIMLSGIQEYIEQPGAA